MDYIKQLHYKLTGGPSFNYKIVKAADKKIEYDSISEITDLSEEGILTTSMNKLSAQERKRIRKFVNEMHKFKTIEPKKHFCGIGSPVSLRSVKVKEVIEMELRAISPVDKMKDERISAHQFSVRS